MMDETKMLMCLYACIALVIIVAIGADCYAQHDCRALAINAGMRPFQVAEACK